LRRSFGGAESSAEPMSGAEKRRDPRVDTAQAVWLEGQEVRFEADAHNMSRSGMFVVARDSLPALGSRLNVSFQDPREGLVGVTMEVVWRADESERPKLGLRVADARGMEAFERVVERLLTEKG
jgi:hypothetical protein